MDWREVKFELIELLLDEYGNEIRAIAQEMKPCEYCET
jgi:GMP synthase PP-ATPase subunit